MAVAQHGKIELMDETMAAYRVHPGCTWSSLPETTRLRESARMLRALDKELSYQYTDAILETAAAPYLQLAIAARSQGRRTDTGHHLLDCVRNGGLRLPGTARIFIGLATYMIIGSGYKMFSRLKDTPRCKPIDRWSNNH